MKFRHIHFNGQSFENWGSFTGAQIQSAQDVEKFNRDGWSAKLEIINDKPNLVVASYDYGISVQKTPFEWNDWVLIGHQQEYICEPAHCGSTGTLNCKYDTSWQFIGDKYIPLEKRRTFLLVDPVAEEE